jgi:hypothetical protein
MKKLNNVLIICFLLFTGIFSQENQNPTYSRNINENGDISYSDEILKATYSKAAKDFSLSKLPGKLPAQYKNWHQLDPATMYMYFRAQYLSQVENVTDEPEEGFHHRQPEEVEAAEPEEE